MRHRILTTESETLHATDSPVYGPHPYGFPMEKEAGQTNGDICLPDIGLLQK